MSDCSCGKGEGRGETWRGGKWPLERGSEEGGKRRKMKGEGWVGKKRKKIKGQEAEGRKEERGSGGTLPPCSLPGPIPCLLDWILVQHLPPWPLPYSEMLSQLAVHHPCLPSLITSRCTRTESMLEPGLWDQLGNTPTCLPRHAFHYSPPSILSLFLTIRKSGFFFFSTTALQPLYS